MRFEILGLLTWAAFGLLPSAALSQSHSIRFKESGCYRASGKIVKASATSLSLEILPGTRSQSVFVIKAPNLKQRPALNDKHEVPLYVHVSGSKTELSTPAAILPVPALDSKLAQQGMQWVRHGKELAACL